jgi:UDP-N-acetylglucosamine:LPS N-acetylglucosamine transferase
MPARRHRILILSAPIGNSHDQMAHGIQRGLARVSAEVEGVVLSSTRHHGAILERLVLGPARAHMERVGWSYEIAYRASTATAATWKASTAALNRLAAPTLLRVLRDVQPRVVVSTYPMTTTVLGHLRRTGRVGVPVCAVVGPLGGLRPWCAPGIDRHLVLYPEAHAEVVRLSGNDDVHVVRAPIDERFYTPCTPQEARARLGLPDRPTVLVSGGGWGAGDLEGAVTGALELPGVSVVVTSGTGNGRRAALEARFQGRSVTVLGFTRDMPLLMRAADVFVTATCGLSCLEARVCGTPAVAYGFAVAHVRDNVRVLERAGVLRGCSDPRTLPGVLAEAMRCRRARGRRPHAPGANLAGLILALAHDGGKQRAARTTPRPCGLRPRAGSAVEVDNV